MIWNCGITHHNIKSIVNSEDIYMTNAITEGKYYQKQFGCDSDIIAWSHRSRFYTALKSIGSPQKLLDYGCGDGTFLSMAANQISAGIGADIALDQVQDCQTRFANLRNLRFATIAEIADPTHTGAYDLVTCMEALEHCTDPIVEVVLKDLARLVAADGRVIISVPIEIGPTFLLKLLLRKLAAIRGLSDYRYYESYSLANAIQMIFSTRDTAIERPVYNEPDAPSHSHYGFNWRSMRERVREHLTIEQTLFSPLPWSGGWFSSQVWFICKPLDR
jgi:2-polyprenyl-3-methyl-5-hydroxy-6-metoxy-1,4-benzoquinol methylase